MTDFTAIKRESIARTLRKNINGEVRFDPTSRRLYSTDASIYQIEPLGVVIPKSTDGLRTTVQIAAEAGVPITARGGGTSLSGQSIGSGIILDCSKYLNSILDVDPSARVARVQPGVVLDELNRTLAPAGLQFGPDVATASRANLGGMAGNNSAGARSIVYGKTNDHVFRLEVILADGSRMEVGPIGMAEWARRAEARSLEGQIYRGVQSIVRENANEIERRFPRILRRVSGYNLDILCTAFNSRNESSRAGLNDLIVGSEGTLAVIEALHLNLVACSRFRGLLVGHFSSLAAAMGALALCLEDSPSAVELLDQRLLDLARANLSLKDTMAAIKGRPAAVLMIEFSGGEEADVADRVRRLARRIAQASGLTAVVPALDPDRRDPLWSLRSSAVPLLYGMRGDRKPVTFVEDTAVSPAALPEFVDRFQEVLARHGTEGAFYGHASVGCLHIRPLLNLKDPADVVRMRRIAEDITDLVLEYGGSLSGEHGDGLARSEWNRKMFGPAVYNAFSQIKQLFDPKNILNPGKVVHAPSMTDNLRYDGSPLMPEPATLFDYSRQEGFGRSIELCNGSGVCRKLSGGTMCPSFRATRDEKDSTRGRANALRLALSGQQPLKDLRSRWVYDVLDLCLMCKGCKAECPSNVDLAKLKAEFLSFYYRRRMRPAGQILMASFHRLNRLGAAAAPLTNWLQGWGLARWILEKVAHIDRRRSLPAIHLDHFRRWFSRHCRDQRKNNGIKTNAGRAGKVILLDDCFTTYYEPHIGQTAVRLLERAGYSVELAGLTCCCRPMISKGFLRGARDLIRKQIEKLAARLEPGTTILGIEPSCALTLADEWPELVPSADSSRIAASLDMADSWIAKQTRAGQIALEWQPLSGRYIVHGHCHQKALRGTEDAAAGLRLIPGLELRVADTGCCGMAGSFGYEKEHYDLSVSIANLSLLPALAAEPAATIVASGTSCRHQIRDLAHRPSLHSLEVMEAALHT
jgi:FAD/FMN-containing dehydrogenase/Fe-S oxidoreductase